MGYPKLLVPTIVTVHTIDYNHYFSVEFGQCVQMYEFHDNSMVTSITGAIVLHPTGTQHGVFFL